MRDEEYFFHSVSPLAWDTKIGPVLRADMGRRYLGGDQERRARLGEMVLREFDHQPGGILLPSSRVAKHVDPARGERVLWKIVRGLFFHEYGRILPADSSFRFQVMAEGTLPEQYQAFALLDSRARKKNRAYFDYRYWSGKLNGFDAQIWGLLLWQKIFAVFVFHDPLCGCTECAS